MNHVAEEVGLPRLAVVGHAHVGQRLLLQDLARVLDALLLGDAGARTARPNEVERHVLLLDDEGLVQRGFHHLHQLGVVKVVDDVFQDVPEKEKNKSLSFFFVACLFAVNKSSERST